MITAHLVGDEKVLARVRAIPSAVSTGLVRTITKLGLDLQGRVQQDLASGQRLASRGGLSGFTVDLNLEQSSQTVAGSRSLICDETTLRMSIERGISIADCYYAT